MTEDEIEQLSDFEYSHQLVDSLYDEIDELIDENHALNERIDRMEKNYFLLQRVFDALFCLFRK